MCQKASCVRGKSRLNLVRSWASVRSKLPGPPLLLKERLARSAILLLAPAMDHGASGEHLVTTWRKDRARTRRWPTKDRLEESRRAHDTVELLSHHVAACLCSSVGAMSSSTSCCRRSPAISKSLMVRSPAGFDGDTRRLVMSGGHLTRHMTG